MKKTSCRRREGWNARRKVGAGKMRTRGGAKRTACEDVDTMGGRGTLEGPARTLRIMLNGGMSAVVNFQNC